VTEVFGIPVEVLNLLIQWLILPAIMWVWTHERRINGLERDIIKTLTILEERNKRRDEDKMEVADLMKELRNEIARLGQRIEKIIESPRV